jgi:DNA-binding SARP family transcriptional activator
MSASAAAGEPARALVAYEALRERLAEELGADPAPQTQEFHLAILRQQDRERSGGHPATVRSVPAYPLL